MKRHVWFVLLLATSSGVAHAQQRTAEAPAAAAGAQTTPAAPQDSSQPGPSTQEQPEGRADETPTPAAGDATLTSVPGSKALGMSILGNQEAPKSLVIVPWKTSELGGSPDVSLVLDDSRQPVDRDVFMRALRYHELSSGTSHPEGATAGSRENAAAPSGAAQSTASHRR